VAAAARLSAWLKTWTASASTASRSSTTPAPWATPRRCRRRGAELSLALRIGLEAPMLLTAAFLGATREWRGARKVLNISSGLGRNAMGSQAPYCGQGRHGPLLARRGARGSRMRRTARASSRWRPA
jgi:benzil reductase ((S)-benzoin forming)